MPSLIHISLIDVDWYLRGTAALNLLSDSNSLCLSSCLPTCGGPISTIGLFLWGSGWYRPTSSYVNGSS